MKLVRYDHLKGFPGKTLLAGLLVCVALLTACAQTAATSRPSPTAQPTLTPTPAFTATPAPPAGSGWRAIGPSNLQTLFFAPGDPLTAYTCFSYPGGQRKPLIFGVSHDGGHTWQFHATALPDTDCQMAVNPTDAQSIALAAQLSVCSGNGCTNRPTEVYISHDGGASWKAASPVGDLKDWGLSVLLAWVGDTLFVGTNGDSINENLGQPPHAVIAASVNGGPMSSVKIDALSAIPTARIGPFLPLGATLYVGLWKGSSVSPSPGDGVYAKADATAAEFTTVSFTYQGSHVYALTASMDGKTLLGQTELYGSAPAPAVPLLASTDGGASWHALPAFPQAQYCCYEDFVYGAADGSVVAEIRVYSYESGLFEPTGIFALRPGAGAWVYAAPPPDGSVIITVSSDASGRPVAVWAPGFGNGLPYHPLP